MKSRLFLAIFLATSLQAQSPSVFIPIPSGSGLAARNVNSQDVAVIGIDGNNDTALFAPSGELIVARIAGTPVASFASTGFSQTVAVVAAAGTVIGDATQLSSIVNRISTVASGAGVKLFVPALTGTCVYVKNLGANALLVYPPAAAGQIDAVTAGASVSVATGAVATFCLTATNAWFSSEAPAA